MEFYQTFLDILDSRKIEKDNGVKTPESRVEIIDDDNNVDENMIREDKPTMKDMAKSEFRKMALEEHGKTIAMVKTLAPALINAICKPQRLIHDDPDYYIAIDCITNTYYVCYRTLMMIDIDFYKDLGTVELIVEKFRKFVRGGEGLRFKLYQSRNGVHAFLVSHPSNYRDDKTISLQLELGSDFYYVIYSYIRGWSVRLNKKRADTSDILYHFICDVGDAEADEHLLKLVDLHLKLVDVFKETGVNTMFGN